MTWAARGFISGCLAGSAFTLFMIHVVNGHLVGALSALAACIASTSSICEETVSSLDNLITFRSDALRGPV